MRHTDINDAMRAVQDASAGLKQLNERSREIFKRIVETYLATGEPVGSRNLSRALPMTRRRRQSATSCRTWRRSG